MSCECKDCSGSCRSQGSRRLCTYGTGSFFVSMPGKRACSNEVLPGLDKCTEHADAEDLRAIVRTLRNPGVNSAQ